MNPSGAMHLTRAVSNRPYPVVSAKTFGTRMNGSGLEPVQMIPMGQPVMMFPTYNYGPYMYVAQNMVPVQPYYYAPAPLPQQSIRRFSSGYGRKAASFAQQQDISPSSPKRGGLIDNRMFNGIKSFGYATASAHAVVEENATEDGVPRITDDMDFSQIYEVITTHMSLYPAPRVSFFNKLLVRCATSEEFNQCLKVLDELLRRCVELTPETGTLLIKAACRAGVSEKALALLKDVDNIRVWPTLGGIHYLMINFALKKDNKALFETLEVAKKRDLHPTTKTFHILIRECVDNGLIDEAMKVMDECFAAGLQPNRTSYNILMNGLRKLGKSKEMLSLRAKMDAHNVEINDTTVKFTTLAYMMERDPVHALQEFNKFPELTSRMEELCEKFFEITAEANESQKKVVVDLFDAIVKQGHPVLPASVQGRLATLKDATA